MDSLPTIHEHRYEYGACVGCGFEPVSDTTSRFAIEYAIRELRSKPSSPELEEVLAMLTMIRDQKGCEALDPACRDGLLTTAMDIFIFG